MEPLLYAGTMPSYGKQKECYNSAQRRKFSRKAGIQGELQNTERRIKR
jgi:hypothetical protein